MFNNTERDISNPPTVLRVAKTGSGYFAWTELDQDARYLRVDGTIIERKATITPNKPSKSRLPYIR